MFSFDYRMSSEMADDCKTIINDLVENDGNDDTNLAQKTSPHKLMLLFKLIGMIRNRIGEENIQQINTYASKAVTDWNNMQKFTRLLTLVV